MPLKVEDVTCWGQALKEKEHTATQHMLVLLLICLYLLVFRSVINAGKYVVDTVLLMHSGYCRVPFCKLAILWTHNLNFFHGCYTFGLDPCIWTKYRCSGWQWVLFLYANKK